MKNIRTLPLTPEDLKPFDSSVVRLFDKQWFAGRLRAASVQDDICRVAILPSIRYSHRNERDMRDPGEAIVHEDAKIIIGSLDVSAKIHLLENAQRIEFDEMPKGVLIIEGNESVAILSSRAIDISQVTNLLANDS